MILGSDKPSEEAAEDSTVDLNSSDIKLTLEAISILRECVWTLKKLLV